MKLTVEVCSCGGGDRGFYQTREKHSVGLVLVVDGVERWHGYLKSKRVGLLSGIREGEQLKAQCFFAEDTRCPYHREWAISRAGSCATAWWLGLDGLNTAARPHARL